MCGSNKIFGGYGLLNSKHTLERTFNLTKLPHSTVYIELIVNLIDLWDTQNLVVLVDRKRTIFDVTHNTRTDSYFDECGNYTNDKRIRLSLSFDHEEDYLNIKIYVANPKLSKLLDQNNPANMNFGISNFKLRLREIEKMNAIRLSHDSDECLYGYYRETVPDCKKRGEKGDAYGGVYCDVCRQCHPLCNTCFGPGTDKCLSCIKGVKYYDEKKSCLLDECKQYHISLIK
jgi:hypothetical protein